MLLVSSVQQSDSVMYIYPFSNSFTAFPGFVICRLFNDGPSDQCEVVLHCSFDLYFSNN